MTALKFILTILKQIVFHMHIACTRPFLIFPRARTAVSYRGPEGPFPSGKERCGIERAPATSFGIQRQRAGLGGNARMLAAFSGSERRLAALGSG